MQHDATTSGSFIDGGLVGVKTRFAVAVNKGRYANAVKLKGMDARTSHPKRRKDAKCVIFEAHQCVEAVVVIGVNLAHITHNFLDLAAHPTQGIYRMNRIKGQQINRATL